MIRTTTVTAAALLLALAATAGAQTLATDTPPGAGNAQGPAPFRFYGTGGSRVQQVYESQLFAGFNGPRQITAMAFRAFPGAFASAFFGTTLTLSDVRIALSTTARGDETGTALSGSFADNIGADATTVFQGALSLTTTTIGAFDYLVTFSTPFTFDPSLGNLLLDVQVPVAAQVGGSGLFGFLTFDTANTVDDGVASVVDVFNGDATEGQFDTAAAITRFFSQPVAVPEPMALGLFGAGLAGLALARRRRQHA